MVKYDKRIVITSILLLITIALVLIGMTYAFFSADIIGNEDATNNVIEAGILRIELEDTEVINIENALPGVSETKTFTVENTGTVAITYNI